MRFNDFILFDPLLKEILDRVRERNRGVER